MVVQQDIHIHLGIELHLICPRCESLTEGLFLCFPWYRLLDSWTENENALVNAMCYRQWAYVCFCVHLCSCMLSQHCICNCILCSCCFTVVGFSLHKFLYIYTYILFIIHTLYYTGLFMPCIFSQYTHEWCFFLFFFFFVCGYTGPAHDFNLCCGCSISLFIFVCLFFYASLLSL